MAQHDAVRDIVLAGYRGDVEAARTASDHHDPMCRYAALGALERLGVLTDDDLIRAFGDAASTVRRRAVSIAATRPAIDFAELLDDDDEHVAETAAWAYGEHEQVSDDVLMRLVTISEHHHAPLVREAAVAALGAIGDDRAVPAILRACTDKPAIRRRAVLALSPFDGDEVEAALATALDDRDWQVRSLAEDVRRARSGS
jgi:HEAT repeat protein